MPFQTPIVLAIILAQPGGGTRSVPSKSVYVPNNLFLVRATTVDIDKVVRKLDIKQLSRRRTSSVGRTRKGDVVIWDKIGTFKITHVYVGPQKLVQEPFQYLIRHAQSGTSIKPDRNRYVEFLEKGSEGLWWLYRDPNDGKLYPELRARIIDEYNIRRFPYQNHSLGSVVDDYGHTFKNDYIQGLAWAEAAAKVYNLKSEEERTHVLKGLAATKQSPIAGWAITLLANVNPKGTLEFLGTLTENARLSADSQVALDRSLARIDPEQWESSEQRHVLMSRWLASDADPADVQEACFRLLEAKRTGQITVPMYAKVVDPALAKGDQLSEERQWWLGRLLREERFRAGDRASAFAWLVRHVRDGKTSLLRAHAASGLNYFRPMTEMQEKIVRVLRDETTDGQVRKELDAVLRD